MQRIWSEILDFRGVGPSFLQHLHKLVEAVFASCFLQIFAFKGGPFWSPFSQISQILHEKSVLKLRLEKMKQFGL